MKHLLPLLLILACDTQASFPIVAPDPPVVALESTGGTSTGEPPAPELSGCACEPDGPACGLGLDCVPVGGEHACLAKCAGENELGGGYVTTCPTTCFYPLFGPLGTGPAYCPACMGCAPVNPLSLICGP
jgi:hypothetical protein